MNRVAITLAITLLSMVVGSVYVNIECVMIWTNKDDYSPGKTNNIRFWI